MCCSGYRIHNACLTVNCVSESKSWITPRRPQSTGYLSDQEVPTCQWSQRWHNQLNLKTFMFFAFSHQMFAFKLAASGVCLASCLYYSVFLILAESLRRRRQSRNLRMLTGKRRKKRIEEKFRCGFCVSNCFTSQFSNCFTSIYSSVRSICGLSL